MVDAKKVKIGFGIFFLFLVLYPFGQLLRKTIEIGGTSLTLQPIDLVVGIASLYALVARFERPKLFKYLIPFLLVATFSFVVSATFFRSQYLLVGLMFLTRLISYSYFLVFVWNLITGDEDSKKFIINSLILVSTVSAVFGWIQYFVFPDLRPLYLIGWDDHLYRLAGTFLDPGFTGFIFFLGLIPVLFKFSTTGEKRWLLLILFFILSIAFTYGRASYVTIVAGLVSFAVLTKKFKFSLILVLLFVATLIFLPRPGSEGVQLERTKSISARLTSYKEGLALAKRFPLLGVGYNNLCLARQVFLGKGNFASHSCSGIDSSLLTIFATTGIVGLITFFSFTIGIVKSISLDYFGRVLIATGVGIFVHSLFVNSLFYPWIMAWIFILIALAIKESS